MIYYQESKKGSVLENGRGSGEHGAIFQKFTEKFLDKSNIKINKLFEYIILDDQPNSFLLHSLCF